MMGLLFASDKDEVDVPERSEGKKGACRREREGEVTVDEEFLLDFEGEVRPESPLQEGLAVIVSPESAGEE